MQTQSSISFPKLNQVGFLELTLPSNFIHSEEQDVFRTFYRLNTVHALRRYFRPAEYEYFVYSWGAEPAYHANFKTLFRTFC